MMGPNVQPLFSPNREQILQHLMHLFGDQQKGMIEIAWTPADTRAVSKARLFDVGQIDEASDFAAETNAVMGQCVYVGAALRKPGTFPASRTEDSDYYGTTAAYVDLDDPGAAESAKALYEACRPTCAVVTGRTPHTRAQLWWKLEDAFGDPSKHALLMAGIAGTLHGDTTVINPSRPMRLGGTVAWPKKEGRVTEMTSVTLFNDRPAVYSSRIEATFPPPTVMPITSLAEGRAPISGKLSTEWLMTEIVHGRMWHKRMVQLVGNWVMRGFTNAEIRGYAPLFTLAGYTLEQTSFEMLRAADDARRKWHQPDPINEFDPEQISPESKFKFLDMDAIDQLQPPTYAIDKLITEHGFTLVWGKQASFKSFFALDMALHMAYGQPFHGRETLPKRVLYIAGEGASGFKNRIGAWRRHYRQASKGDFYMLATGINLIGKVGADELIAAIKAFGPPFDYIFVDTVARAMLGAEENDASSMGLFILACDMVRSAFGCGLLAVHHSGEDSALGPRGSTALPAAVDTDFLVERTEGTQFVSITCKKQKDDEEPALFRFKAERVDVSHLGIAGQGSLVMLPADGVSTVDRKLSKREVNEFLSEAQRAWDAKKPWNNSPQTKKDGRYFPMWISRRFGIGVKAAESYVSELLYNEYLAIEVCDKKTKKVGLRVLKFHPAEVAEVD